MVAEDGVLVGVEALDQAHAQPVFRHVGAALDAGLGRVDDGQALDGDGAGGRVADAGHRLQQLRLAIAGDTGDADDLACAHREADAFHPRHAQIVGDVQVVHLEDRLAGPGRRLVDAQQHLAADHQLGQLLAAGVGGAAIGHHRTLAHHRDVVGNRHDLAQLVGDQDDGTALCLEVAQDAEQMVGLLRGQHAGRLVEDQDPGAAKQRLQDLDALLDADGKVLDAGVEVDLQRIVALERLDLLARPGGAVGEGEAALGAEQHVLQHGERLDQHEVLVDHADPGADGILGAGDAPFLAIDQDGAGIGLVVAVDDVHQGRFAGAVLADDAVDAAGRDAQRDRLVGVDGAEALVDAAQLDGRREDLHRHRHDLGAQRRPAACGYCL